MLSGPGALYGLSFCIALCIWVAVMVWYWNLGLGYLVLWCVLLFILICCTGKNVLNSRLLLILLSLDGLSVGFPSFLRAGMRVWPPSVEGLLVILFAVHMLSLVAESSQFLQCCSLAFLMACAYWLRAIRCCSWMGLLVSCLCL